MLLLGILLNSSFERKLHVFHTYCIRYRQVRLLMIANSPAYETKYHDSVSLSTRLKVNSSHLVINMYLVKSWGQSINCAIIRQ
jgi:hypothetical protein